MRPLSSMDVHYLARELAPMLENSVIRKVYVEGPETHIRVYKRGVGEGLLVAGPELFYYTFSGMEHEQEPSPFCMFLRKRLKNQPIQKIEQLGFERIVHVETRDYHLYLELFGGTNVVLTDKNNTIIIVREGREWSSRTLRKGVEYSPPPTGIDPRRATTRDLLELFSSSQKKIVSLLARDLGLGGIYAEEALSRAGIEKDRVASTLSEREAGLLVDTIRSLLDARLEPLIARTREGTLEPFPYPMESLELETVQEEDKYFLAVASCALASHGTRERTGEAPKKKESKLEKRLETQKKRLEELEMEEKEARTKGDLVYLHYQEIEHLLEKVRKRIEREGWNSVAESPPEGVLSIDPKNKTMRILLDGTEIELYVMEPPQKSAEKYYSLAKQSRAKIGRLLEAIRDTEKEIASQKEKQEETRNAPGERKPEKKKWYHDYKWFVSSEGFLCVCARDAKTNEELIKKRMEKHDIVFHTEMAGSPFLLVKTHGKKPGEATLREAAAFVASHSKAWKQGLGSIEVFWVRPDQVSKKPPAGEYLSKGAFMIYGKKNILRTELALGIGIVEGEIRAWPVGAISARTKKFVVIRPGDTPARDLAEQVIEKLSSLATLKEKEILKKKGKSTIPGLVPYGKGMVA